MAMQPTLIVLKAYSSQVLDIGDVGEAVLDALEVLNEGGVLQVTTDSVRQIVRANDDGGCDVIVRETVNAY